MLLLVRVWEEGAADEEGMPFVWGPAAAVDIVDDLGGPTVARWILVIFCDGRWMMLSD